MLNFPVIDPAIVQIGPLAVRWYGFMYFLGFISAWILGRSRTKRQKELRGPFDPQQFDDVLLWGIFGVIAGARLGYVVFYNPAYYFQWEHLIEIAYLWEGGMSFHGGLIGVMLCQWISGLKYGRSFFETMDFMAPLVPPGIFFGRIGNFINGELWGRATDLPWGMVFPGAGPLPRHPSQLYECALEGAVLFFILWIFSGKKRPRKAVSGLFLLGYGTFRFIIEFARQPDAHIGFIAGGFLTMGMLLCLPMILFGILLLFLAYRKHQPK